MLRFVTVRLMPLVLATICVGCARTEPPSITGESTAAKASGSESPIAPASTALPPESSAPPPASAVAAESASPALAAPRGGGDQAVTPTKANDYCSIRGPSGVCLQHCYPGRGGKCLARPHGKLAPPPPR